MNDEDLRRRRNKDRELAPGEWWTVEQIDLSPGFLLFYNLSPRQSRPSDVRDRRGRTALEAFGALPTQAMADRLEAYRASLGTEGEWATEDANALIVELISFVRTFGPIGVGWGAEFGVRNPDAEVAEREVQRQHWQLMGLDPDQFGQRDMSREQFWTVTYQVHGPGRTGLPMVSRNLWYPGKPWPERVRLNDLGLPHDYWIDIVEAVRELRETVALAEAVAGRDQLACRSAIREFMPGDPEINFGPPAPSRVDYGPALRGARPARGLLKPFALPSHRIDWVILGRRFLAELIGRQIDFAMPLADVTASEEIAVRWRTTSVLEVVYLELLDHVRRHPDFGIGTCGKCGGPIVRTRRPGVSGNRWHPGCRGGRIGTWREKKRSAAARTSRGEGLMGVRNT